MAGSLLRPQRRTAYEIAIPRHVLTSAATPAIERYLAEGVEQVGGWGIDAFLARVFVGLDQFQKAGRIEGNLLEIGVFQGRTGILLALMAVPPTSTQGHCWDRATSKKHEQRSLAYGVC